MDHCKKFLSVHTHMSVYEFSTNLGRKMFEMKCHCLFSSTLTTHMKNIPPKKINKKCLQKYWNICSPRFRKKKNTFTKKKIWYRAILAIYIKKMSPSLVSEQSSLCYYSRGLFISVVFLAKRRFRLTLTTHTIKRAPYFT